MKGNTMEGSKLGDGKGNMTIRAFITRHSVPIYFALTFAISWGGWVSVVGTGGLLGTAEKLNTVLPAAAMALMLGPIVAGILMTGLVHGRAGLRELGSSLVRWRVGARWYAIALLPTMFLPVVVLLALGQTSPIFTEGDKVVVLMSGIGAGFMTIMEELGWTGFAIPQLRLRHGIVRTGLIVGVLWGAWHLLQVVWVGSTYVGAVPLAIFLPQYFLFSVAQLTAMRVLLVWVYDRTGSLLMTILMHASYTASTTVIFRPLGIGASFLVFGYVLAAVLWSVVAVVAVANGWWVPRRATGTSGITARARGIVRDLMRNRNGMDIVGQGGKIILFMLPALLAAIAVHAYLPGVAALPEGIGVIRLLGYPLLLAGLALWGVAVVQLMRGFPQGGLVTTGAYGVVRNPIYSSMAWLILPAVALITMTWVYLVASAFLYVGVMVLIGKEEEGLARVFGREYEDYTARVDRMVPFRGYFRGSRTVQRKEDAPS